ncbi:MAG: hypothetical protein EA381_07155 [Planctomycetaceae bacterium]|nr:MAG: hypothetical protein EA381_07155 [Planctomycetaceae bacterium]
MLATRAGRRPPVDPSETFVRLNRGGEPRPRGLPIDSGCRSIGCGDALRYPQVVPTRSWLFQAIPFDDLAPTRRHLSHPLAFTRRDPSPVLDVVSRPVQVIL